MKAWLGAALLVLASFSAALESARPWIGIQLGDGQRGGVRVTGVIPGTPADKAGIRTGDEVLAIDSAAVSGSAALIAQVRADGVGQTVRLRLWRGDHEMTLSLALEARPDELQMVQQLVGKPAPALAVTGERGAYPAALDKLAGDVVVLEFWATWCGPCMQSFPRLSDWQAKYGGRGLRVVGVAPDDGPADLERFLRGRQVLHTLALDRDHETARAYFVAALPSMFVIDRGGVVRYAHIGGGKNLDEVEAAFLPLLDK